MADAVTTQIINSGPQNIVIKLTSISDGSGEVLVKKFDTTAFNPSPGTHLTIWEIEGNVKDMLVALYWDATTPQQLVDLNGYYCRNYRRFGGLVVPNISGVTGSILLSTLGAMPNSSYDIVLQMRRNVSP